MIRILWRSDLHLADKPPRSRTDDWTETLLDKLRQVGKIARDVDAAAVIDGGDLFHIKTPTRNSHGLVQRVARVHQGYPCPTYVVPGNHDCKHGDYELLDETPLGVLYSTGCLKRLYDRYEATFYTVVEDELGNHVRDPEGTTVRVVGVPYHGTRYDLGRFEAIEKGDETWLVVVAHCLASEQGGRMFEGEDILAYSDLAELEPDVYCFGHWHKNQGISELKNSLGESKLFINVGSMSRGALSEDDVTRNPLIVVLDFSARGISASAVALDVKPSEEVFDLEKKAYEDSKQMSVDAFVQELNETLDLSQDISLTDIVRAMPEQRGDVRERAVSFLERVGAR